MVSTFSLVQSKADFSLSRHLHFAKQVFFQVFRLAAMLIQVLCPFILIVWRSFVLGCLGLPTAEFLVFFANLRHRVSSK